MCARLSRDGIGWCFSPISSKKPFLPWILSAYIVHVQLLCICFTACDLYAMDLIARWKNLWSVRWLVCHFFHVSKDFNNFFFHSEESCIFWKYSGLCKIFLVRVKCFYFVSIIKSFNHWIINHPFYKFRFGGCRVSSMLAIWG